ncbi:MAG TPA: hypothetical protein VMF30_08080 [Pirellulales bacterium]|nr:hypothetical protein [Pirellulales bacterium]
MPADFSTGSQEAFAPQPSALGPEARERFESRLEPVYCDLLPWADPYIAALVRDLQAATGGMLPQAWPRSSAPENNAPPRHHDRWRDQFRRDFRADDGHWSEAE